MLTLDGLKTQQTELLKQANSPEPIKVNVLHDLYRQISTLENAIKWMTEGGIEEIEQLGPLGSKDIVRGQTVMVRKGTIINTTNPSYDRENPKIAKRSYKVKVHRVTDGYLAW